MTFIDLVAGHDLSGLWSMFTEWHAEILSESVISSLWSKITGAAPAIMIGVIFILLSLIQTVFGKKLLFVEKYAFFAYVGFIMGEHFLITRFPLQIFGWIFGLLCGVALAIMARELYYIAYALVIGYATFTILYGGYYLPAAIVGMTKGNLAMALAIAAAVSLVALLLHKFVELVGCSALGAWCLVLSLNYFLTYTLGVEMKSPITLILVGVFTVGGILVQKLVFVDDDL